MEFKAGDVVRLKSGGPAMTVSWVQDCRIEGGGTVAVYCEWFQGDAVEGRRFFAEQLANGGEGKPD